MQIKPIRRDLLTYLKKRSLFKKFKKQVELFTQNPRHPSLHTEILLPRHLKLYSFRLDKKYRVIFIKISSEEVEIVDINDHYK